MEFVQAQALYPKSAEAGIAQKVHILLEKVSTLNGVKMRDVVGTGGQVSDESPGPMKSQVTL